MGSHAWARLCAITLIAVGGAVPAQGATPVTSCGTTVTGVAELVGDLDCSGYDGPAVTVDGTLRLNGHTLTGYADTTTFQPTVYCHMNEPKSCAIVGPGAIVGGGIGVYGQYIKLKDVTVSGAGTGVEGGRVQLRSCTITGNGQVLQPGTHHGGGVMVGYRLTVVDSTVNGNGFYGVSNHGELRSWIRIKRSTLVGNGNVAAYCSGDRFFSCGDIVTWVDIVRTKVSDTTCGTSRIGTAGDTLGLCSGD